ncbi:MAG: TrkH family potassium uptake protein [Treponema sp.]|nr:TrkH family potassium uptake protein [Treponema sp.]
MAITITKIISIIIAFIGVTYLIPIAVALSCSETQVLLPFIIPMIISWILAAIFLLGGKKIKMHLSTRGAFIVVALAWIAGSAFGAIPLYFSGALPSFTDAFFESVSGFSTTGATICTDIEALPRSINLWRCQTHWLGGMGIVALTVAVLPLLGVGGFQLIKAETTGPEKGKVTPKITTTAKVLWLTYTAFTAILMVLLLLAGMDFIDALSHAFATLGTGGFSTKNAGIGGFNSLSIDIIFTVFMFIASINFSIYYYAITKKFAEIRDNSELKVFLAIFFFCLIAVTLIITPQFGNFFTALRYGSFQVAAISSTTGFGTSDFTTWAPSAQFILFALYFFGGCAGSTAGGVKVVRWIILAKQVHNETLRMIHPHGIFSIRLNGKVGRKDIVFNVASFMTMYFALVALTTAIGCFCNIDLYTSFTGALSMVGNVGPAFGKLGPSFNYGFLPSALKWWYCFAMLAGRLELYTIILFFMPAFWKK